MTLPKRTNPEAKVSTPSVSKTRSDEGKRHRLACIDPVIHAPARLMIAAHLYVVAAADAVFLQNMTGLTWGNLSSHIRKLEEAGYVVVEKTFIGRKPKTAIALTDKGRDAFRDYRANMLESLELLDT